MLDHNPTSRCEIIARLNDRCRQGLDRRARIVVTQTCIAALAGGESVAAEAIAQARLMQELRRHTFDADTPERNRGDFDVDGTRVYFAIDYYDAALEFGSEDPADAAVTRRVLTLMLREDL